MRKFMKKLTSGILTAAMVASLVAVVPATKVEAANDNLITNGGFSSGLTTPWEFSNNTDVTNLAKDWGSHDGDSNCLTVVRSDTSASGNVWVEARQTVTSLSKGKYRLTVYAMGSGGGLKTFAGTTWTENAAGDAVWTNIAADWAVSELEFTLTENADSLVVGFGFNKWPGDATYYIDDISLVKENDESSDNDDESNLDYSGDNLITGGTFDFDDVTITPASGQGTWKYNSDEEPFDTLTNQDNLLNFWDQDGVEEEILFYQTIDKLKAGTYRFYASVYGKDSELKFYLNDKTKNITLTEDEAGFAAAYFTLEKDIEGNSTVGFIIKPSADGWGKIDNVSLVLGKEKSYTFDMLKELLQSDKIPAEDQYSEYTAETISLLEDALENANKITESSTYAELETAYKELDKAIEGLKAKARTIVNGDFSKALGTEWTTVVEGFTGGESNHGVKDSALNVYADSDCTDGGSFTISQTLTLKPGIYQFEVKNAGDSRESKSKLSYTIDGEGEKTVPLAKLVSWNTWTPTRTESFTLEEEKDVIIAMTVTVGAGEYENIDDIRLCNVIEELVNDLNELIYSITDTTIYTEESLKGYNTAKDNATKIAEKDNPTEEEITNAYATLQKAIAALVEKTAINTTEIYVKKIPNLSDDFITGVDVSSFIAEYESGVRYYDFDSDEPLDKQGFFDFLKKCGVNWVRVRVWNDPYDSMGYGYGGGNCDIDVAKEIGVLAKNAGIRTLVDFHYSDFWTDPSKQMVPKEWEGMDIDEKAAELKKFTVESLEELTKAGVDVGMVQIGNETNNGICGETTANWENMAKLFRAGSEGVREVDEDILVTIHLADPDETTFDTYAGKLKEFGVDYDVFACSYYPYFHGTIENLQKALTKVAKDYKKKVMVAETTYLTTWDDGDGHDNTRRKSSIGSNAFAYDVSPQGQADEFRAVANAVASIKADEGTENEKTMGIGVFSWEPAWIPVENLAGKSEAQQKAIKEKNAEKWEKYGSGWASSYSAEYDPDDAGRWFGGSCIDNEAIFDFDGKALPSAMMYRYIRTGTTGTTADEVVSVVPDQLKTVMVSLGADPIPSTKATVYKRDYSQKDENGYTITWDEEAIKEAIQEVGTYKIPGTVTVGTKTYDFDDGIYFTLEVRDVNYLDNYGFELPDSDSGNRTSWDITVTEGAASIIKYNGEDGNYQNGKRSVKFWSDSSFKFTGEQKVTLNKGIYVYGGYIEGKYADKTTSDDNVLRVYTTIDGKTTYSENGELTGYLNFNRVEIPEIVITEDGTEVICGFETEAAASTWGCWDDMYLNKLSTEEEEKAAADADKLIADIGAVTLEKADQINKARTAYDKLQSNTKKLVVNIGILEAAEKELDGLEAAEAKKVDALIAAIGTVDLNSRTAIDAARKAYDGLTQAIKDKVTKLEVLKSLESEITKLENDNKSNEQAADNVDKLIEAIGTVTLDSKAAITQARTAYDALSDGAKAKVTKLALLKTAEEELSKLEEAEEARKSAEEKAAAEKKKAADESVGAVVESTSTDTKYNITTSPAAEGSTAAVEFAGTTDNTEAVVTIQDTVKDAYGVEYVVTKIADNAFNSSKVLTDVTIGANVKEIGQNAFKNCTKLSNVIIQSDSIAKINAGAFSGAKALKSIDLSECNLEVIDKNAFSGCKKLSNIKINGNKLTKVGKNAFKNVKKNAKITIYAKNKKTYKKIVKLIKKSGAKNVKYAYKKKK
ncbi:MAG: glycosyl hydrolase 53 family protein [Lachnospiraceae bacterium]|nr:glycosyl hydrolase 53 family protein [Lachnospiraceae bacterium]